MTKQDRKRLAEKLHAEGWTMQRIGDALGVSKECISKDLGRLQRRLPQINKAPAKSVSAALLDDRDRRIAGEAARDFTATLLGDPPIGFSALDRRHD